MNLQQILAMAVRKSLTLAAGIVIGAWLAVQYPESTKAVFESSVASLVAALVALAVSGKMSVNVVKTCGKGTETDKPV